MRFRFLENINSYSPEPAFGTEICFFLYGIVISRTPRKESIVEYYDIKADTVNSGKGYIQKQRFFYFENKKIKKYIITKSMQAFLIK